ncbi:hypothetical protein [Streptomyces nojiriensis]|uniref:hypothetical protein n=1 Tax=Streptomyces nojiriensis TaxID=66374 RepID=UPI003665B672
MTDLLHRLASRATGRRGRPATVPLLPPRPGAERGSGKPVGPGQDTTQEEVRDVAVHAQDGEASGRGTGTGRGPADDRPVRVPAAAPSGPPPVALPAPGAPPQRAPIADDVRRETPTGPARRVEAGETAQRPRPIAEPVSPPPATAGAPSDGTPAVRTPADDGGTSPVPHGRQEPGERRPNRRLTAPGQDPARPTRREEARGAPVVRPVPVPAPVPPPAGPRSAAPLSLVAPAEPAPAVTITIGRVEIRAVPPAAYAPAPSEPDGALRGGTGATSDTLSLGDFLRGSRDPR